jgi:two-component system sensor histidine kinase DesK
MVAIVITGFGVINAVKFLGEHHSPAPLVIGIVDTALILLMQVAYFGSAERRSGRARIPMLITQAVLVYAPAPWLGVGWLGMPSFLASSCLLVLSPAPAWIAFAVIVVGNLGHFALVGDTAAVSLAYTFIASVNTALVVYGLIRMSELVVEVDQSRAALAQVAVEKERTRFARDLHDLLGYSLSTVAHKVELTLRLGLDNWTATSRELREVLRITRQALADVRMVSSGYRNMSLESELRSVRSILRVAGVETKADVQLDISVLSQQTSTVLSTVLREGVTNMLRHSDPDRCEITIDRTGDLVRVCMLNDGITDVPDEQCVGSGIRNLTLRVESLGGRLQAGVLPDGWFRLRAEVHDRPASGTSAAAVVGKARRRWGARPWAKKHGPPEPDTSVAQTSSAERDVPAGQDGASPG